MHSVPPLNCGPPLPTGKRCKYFHFEIVGSSGASVCFFFQCCLWLWFLLCIWRFPSRGCYGCRLRVEVRRSMEEQETWINEYHAFFFLPQAFLLHLVVHFLVLTVDVGFYCTRFSFSFLASTATTYPDHACIFAQCQVLFSGLRLDYYGFGYNARSTRFCPILIRNGA